MYWKWKIQVFQDLTNRPSEHTPNPQPTVYEGIGDVWGMLQGYVGFPLEVWKFSWGILGETA